MVRPVCNRTTAPAHPQCGDTGTDAVFRRNMPAECLPEPLMPAAVSAPVCAVTEICLCSLPERARRPGAFCISADSARHSPVVTGTTKGRDGHGASSPPLPAHHASVLTPPRTLRQPCHTTAGDLNEIQHHQHPVSMAGQTITVLNKSINIRLPSSSPLPPGEFICQ